MSISEEGSKSELRKTRSWYLIFHSLQFQINESPPLFMEVLREVLGDVFGKVGRDSGCKESSEGHSKDASRRSRS